MDLEKRVTHIERRISAIERTLGDLGEVAYKSSVHVYDCAETLASRVARMDRKDLLSLLGLDEESERGD